jgi:hypothetical protein
MTSLLDRFTAPAEPEGGTLTQPYRPDARPFWLGIPGLDPAYPSPADAELAARIAAEACAVHAHGMTAIMAPFIGKSPAQKYLDWLLDARTDLEAWLRRYALRVTCDRADGADASGILSAAAQVAAFVNPGRRR